MKILHLIIFTLVAITVMSCLNESTGDECGNDFFPLNVGDKFLYRRSDPNLNGNYETSGEVEIRVTRVVNRFGKMYYEIENYYILEYGNEITASAYVRTDKNNVYFLAENGEDIPYYRFDIPEDSIYKVPYVIYLDPSDKYRNKYIKVSECSKKHILFLHNPYTVDLDYYVRFEKGKGRTQVLNNAWFRIRYDLVKIYR
jgi:hypothetical protein